MKTAADIVADLDRLYIASVARLKAALNAYLVDGTAPDPKARSDGSSPIRKSASPSAGAMKTTRRRCALMVGW
jgi:hypothetical protein